MAFQPINFSGISPIGLSALRNMPQIVGQGMQAGFMPEQEQRQSQQAALSNALTKLQTQYLPQEYESQKSLREAQSIKALQDAEKQKMLTSFIGQVLGGGGIGGEGLEGSGLPSDLGKTLLMKLAFGIDETPMQQAQREISTAGIKERQSGEIAKEFPTRQVLTEYQKRANQTQPFITTVEKLIESPSPMEYPGGFFKPNQQAKHQALVDSAADSYLMVRGLPATVENIHLAKRVLGRHRFESDKAYRERLKDTLHEVLEGAVPYYSETDAKIPDQMKKYLKGNEKKADLADPLGLR